MGDTVEFTALELLGERVGFSIGNYMAKSILHIDSEGAYVPLKGNRIRLNNGDHIIPLALGEIIKFKYRL